MLSDEQRGLLERLREITDLQAALTHKENEVSAMLGAAEQAMRVLAEERSAINRILAEKTLAFPWLADAIAQYHEACDLKIAEFLEKKLIPASTAANRVKALAAEKREFQKKYRLARNRLIYYERLFPHLAEYVTEGIDDLVRQVQRDTAPPPDDEVRRWITDGEYHRLSVTERNQRALDHWKASLKPPWEIGRWYERYIGYMLEKCGFSVAYHGIEWGLADLGRDLVASKGNVVQVIQCKCWAREKKIHEKHIFQLFGTTVEWLLKNRECGVVSQPELFPGLLRQQRVVPVFYTSAFLSDKAAEFAQVLGVQVHQDIPLDQDYPMIKCNRSHRTGELIYHLPFDQQYDRTTIDEERNECYVATVAEAEQKGYRRAWRWRGEQPS